MFDKKLHGLSSPQALLNTVWLDNTIHFDHRGCKEQKQLGWGDIVLKTDSEKNEVKSQEVGPKRKKRRLIIESDSSQEST